MAAHRYWRIFSRNNHGGSCTTICEVEMKTTPGGASVCTGGTPIRSSFQAGWEPTKAFDGIKTGDQGWASANADIDGAWIGYDFGAGNDKEIVEISITSRGTGGASIQQSPRIFWFEFSDDNTTWYRIGGGEMAPAWGLNETRTYEVPTSVSYVLSHIPEFGSLQAGLSLIRPASFKLGYTGGDAKFAGTVAPGIAPIEGTQVRVFDAVTRLPAGEGVTNSIGEWEVNGLRPHREYFLVASNADSTWEYTVSSRRVPTITSTLLPQGKSGEMCTSVLVRPTWTATGNLVAAGFRSSGQYTIRQSIPRSRFVQPTTKLKLNLQAYSSAATVINSAYLGIRSGYTDNFASAPTQIFFGGNPGVTIAANTNVQTDEITLTVNPGEDLLLSVVVDGTSGANMTYTAPVLDNTWSSYAKASVSEGSNLTVSGYTEQLNVCSMVRNFEYYAVI